MSPITTHVLDTARGCPAAGLPLTLEIQREGRWHELAAATTNADGRVANLLAPGALEAARYRITFHTAAYFSAIGTAGFYPWVEVVFDIAAPEQHYHVPLLLCPFGYSTYRGS